jgi:hypothetical protein
MFPCLTTQSFLPSAHQICFDALPACNANLRGSTLAYEFEAVAGYIGGAQKWTVDAVIEMLLPAAECI